MDATTIRTVQAQDLTGVTPVGDVFLRLRRLSAKA
jgi:hypothetical protein